jgi:hypothetical protein
MVVMDEEKTTSLPWEPLSKAEPVNPPPAPEKGLANIVQEGFYDVSKNVVPSEERTIDEKTESKISGNRIDPDSRGVLLLAVSLVMILMISSFVVSFFGIWGIAAETTNIPQPITWIPALFLDAAILAYTISYFVFQSRGEPVWRTRLALWTFALLSVAANIAHTVQIFTPETTLINIIVGLGITASAPVAVVLASEEVARLAFKKPRKKN